MSIIRNNQLSKFFEKHKNIARLLISCPDQPGIVASISNYLFSKRANIIHSSQHSTDPFGGQFFMRVEFELADLEKRRLELEEGFKDIAQRFEMEYRFSYAHQLKRMAIFVSKQEHCLLELLWQWQAGDLTADISLVISNHEDMRSTVESLNIPFYHIPVTKENKKEAERKQLDLIKDKVDFIVLARYMQILSPSFVEQYPNQIINIHHSFLPAFIGGRPYERAYERGVKIIGATSHYVTNELDEGPIIEQDITRVDHSYDVNELKRIGRHIERIVLARAVAWHIEDRVIVHGNKTIVFN